MIALVERARGEFRVAFGVEPTHFGVSPGRVNLIGEHTDYQGGFVLPVAIDRRVAVAARLAVGRSRVVSESLGSQAEFVAGEFRPQGSWIDYVAGMAWSLLGYPNIDAAIVSDLPVGAGLSSSAALEMSVGKLLCELVALPLTNTELARAGQRAENEFVGMKCGIMDQTAAVFGRSGHALFVDTLDAGNPVPVRLPADLSIVVCDTGVKHELAGSAYNERREQVERAAKVLGVDVLRWATTDQVASHRAALGDVCTRRALHVVTENKRVLDFRTALEAGDEAAVGALMQASHESLRADYEVSCVELDAMVEAAGSIGSCVGCRMTGGGFGGACVALVKKGAEPKFVDRVAAAYERKTDQPGAFYSCLAVDGASAGAY